MYVTGGGPRGYMSPTACGGGEFEFSRLLADARVKCAYCGRRQIPERSGSCCGCGANLP